MHILQLLDEKIALAESLLEGATEGEMRSDRTLQFIHKVLLRSRALREMCNRLLDIGKFEELQEFTQKIQTPGEGPDLSEDQIRYYSNEYLRRERKQHG